MTEGQLKLHDALSDSHNDFESTQRCSGTPKSRIIKRFTKRPPMIIPVKENVSEQDLLTSAPSLHPCKESSVSADAHESSNLLQSTENFDSTRCWQTRLAKLESSTCSPKVQHGNDDRNRPQECLTPANRRLSSLLMKLKKCQNTPKMSSGQRSDGFANLADSCLTTKQPTTSDFIPFDNPQNANADWPLSHKIWPPDQLPLNNTRHSAPVPAQTTKPSTKLESIPENPHSLKITQDSPPLAKEQAESKHPACSEPVSSEDSVASPDAQHDSHVPTENDSSTKKDTSQVEDKATPDSAKNQKRLDLILQKLRRCTSVIQSEQKRQSALSTPIEPSEPSSVCSPSLETVTSATSTVETTAASFSNGPPRQTQANLPKKSSSCYNCNGEGHTFHTCPRPARRFCHRCGLKEVTVKNCPRCSKEQKNDAR